MAHLTCQLQYSVLFLTEQYIRINHDDKYLVKMYCFIYFCIKKSYIGIFHIYNKASKMATKDHVAIFLLLIIQNIVSYIATFCESFTAIG